MKTKVTSIFPYDLDHPLTYKDVPLDHLSFKLFGRPQVTHLREVKLGYADGLATAMMDIFMPVEAKIHCDTRSI